MSGLEPILGFLKIAAPLVGAAGTIASGNQQKAMADYQAEQQEMLAKEEKAASQREADRAKRERDFVLSRQQAVAASSGLGALDETVLDLAGDVAQESAVQTGTIRYGGNQRAAGRLAQAAASRMEGRAARTASLFDAGSTIMGGIGSFAGMRERQKQAPAYSSQFGYG